MYLHVIDGLCAHHLGHGLRFKTKADRQRAEKEREGGPEATEPHDGPQVLPETQNTEQGRVDP